MPERGEQREEPRSEAEARPPPPPSPGAADEPTEFQPGTAPPATQAKSVARMPLAWVRMNCAHVGPVRPAAGSIPADRRIVQTVDAAIR